MSDPGAETSSQQHGADQPGGGAPLAEVRPRGGVHHQTARRLSRSDINYNLYVYIYVALHCFIFSRHVNLDKYPTGEMTKEQFVAYSLEKDELAEEDNAGSLFEIFDKDSSGSMDFSEFLMANQASKVYIIETVYRA